MFPYLSKYKDKYRTMESDRFSTANLILQIFVYCTMILISSGLDSSLEVGLWKFNFFKFYRNIGTDGDTNS